MTHYVKTQEAVEGLEWPCEMDISQESVLAYEKAIDVVDGAHEETDQLVKALHLFASCGSYPLAAAGIAYTLIAASRQSHGKYVNAGLKAAQMLLNQAREIVDDRIEINFFQLFIDIAYENYAQYQRRYERV